MATHCSILAWRIPWTEEPGGLQSIRSQGVGHDWMTKPPPPPSVWEGVQKLKQLRSKNIIFHPSETCLMTGKPCLCLHWAPWRGLPALSSLPQVCVSCSVMSDSYNPMDCSLPLSMGFSRREYWSALPFPSPEDFPDPGIEPGAPALQADSLPTELWGKLIKILETTIYIQSMNSCMAKTHWW